MFIEIIRENKITTIEQAQKCEPLWNAKGRTLCVKCHLKIGLRKGRERNSKKFLPAKAE